MQDDVERIAEGLTKADCAVCGRPYRRHNIGTITTCPIIATYRPREAFDAAKIADEIVPAGKSVTASNRDTAMWNAAHQTALRAHLLSKDASQ